MRMTSHLARLHLIEPMRQLADTAPWIKVAGPPIGTFLAFLWGEAFIMLALLYVTTAMWDWVLGGQLAARRSRAAEALGEPPENWGGFDSEVARSGLLVKLSLLIQIGIIYTGELWMTQTFGLRWEDFIPGVFGSFAPEGQVTILSVILMVAATLNELRSCERNRRYLGGSNLPLFSQAMDVLDRLAEKLVPSDPNTTEDEGWHPLPPVDERPRRGMKRRGRRTPDERDKPDE